jgi:hypothetical protein
LANGNPVKQIEKLVENQELGSQLTSSMEDLSVGKLLRTHNIASFISRSNTNLEAPALLPSFFWLPQLAVQFYEARFLNCALPSGKKKCNDQEKTNLRQWFPQ